MPPFGDFTDVSKSGTVLFATSENDQGKTCDSSIDLNNYIGIKSTGTPPTSFELYWGGSNFSSYSDDGSELYSVMIDSFQVDLSSACLKVKVRITYSRSAQGDEEIKRYIDYDNLSIDLEDRITSIDGCLSYK
ncbi:hypothetical protein FRC07_001942 [Ceratobasidium sp. 392]|nr:hypothetical protein FRC07_001942 [Ceratobasidium sp. 392]